MKNGKLVFAIILTLIFACKKDITIPVEQLKEIEVEIKKLETTNDKKIYLEKILEQDQAVRDGEESANLMLKYGQQSDEYRKYIKAQWKQDEINLIKIENYLKEHGYPQKEMGETAITAPWIVIHHSESYEARERNFERIYEAYLKGIIDDTAISFYLGRMYQIKNKERFLMENSFKPEDEINQLIKELNLEEKKTNTQQRLKKQP